MLVVSTLVPSELLNDYQERLKFLHQKEMVQIQTACLSEEKQLNKRTILLSWVAEICESNNFQIKTFELSLRYVDSYLSTHVIADKYLQLLALTSVFIARKINEVQTEISLNDYLMEFQVEYTVLEMKNMEIAICKGLQWSLNLITPSDYIQQKDVSPKIESLIIYMMISPSFAGQSPYLIFQTSYYKEYQKFPFQLQQDLINLIMSNLKILNKELQADSERMDDDFNLDNGKNSNQEVEKMTQDSSNSKEDYEPKLQKKIKQECSV